LLFLVYRRLWHVCHERGYAMGAKTAAVDETAASDYHV